MPAPIVVLGVPTALGGHLGGMERTPPGLRELGILDRLAARPGLAGAPVHDAGDVPIEPGFRPDPDPRAKNRELIAAFLPRVRDLGAAALRDAGPDARLLVLGGDCTSNAGAMAAIRAARTGPARIAVAWFDAHGDFNTPDTTPSGNVWGMPFAMLCGIGATDLVSACDGPTAEARDCCLVGGQVLDERESRMLATAGVAHFGAGMLASGPGMAALAGWAEALGRQVDGLYIAFDHDVLDGDDGWAVQMPEPDGLSLETAIEAVRTLAGAVPVLGFGGTAINLANGDAPRTADALAALVEAAFAGRPER